MQPGAQGRSAADALATDGLERLFGANLEPVRVVRNLGLNLLDKLPAVKRRLIAHAMGKIIGDFRNKFMGKTKLAVLLATGLITSCVPERRNRSRRPSRRRSSRALAAPRSSPSRKPRMRACMKCA
jgi:hypothetical protein